MVYVAALYTGKKVVTGACHGDAFNRLSVEEQDGELHSGFYDPETGSFVSDDKTFYNKELVLIRHANVFEGDNPGITPLGEDQCRQSSKLLQDNFDLVDFFFFSSPCQRCVETATSIVQGTKIDFSINNMLQDKNEKESPHHFLLRLKEILFTLPQKSIVISHCNCIIHLAQMVSGLEDITTSNFWIGEIPHCSIIYVRGHDLTWIAK
jgi:broad specificity phosphatase PhoE